MCLITRDARSTISVIVVAGACGIAAGTPLAILGAIGRAAASGAVVKGGLYLEILSSVDTVVLDKTGTLTLCTPEIFEVHAHTGATDREVIRIAATAERFSEHPLAKAILKRASEWSVPAGEPRAFQYIPGKGIACEIEGERTLVGTRSFLNDEGIQVPDTGAGQSFTEVLVATEGRLRGSIRLADVLRSEAAEAVGKMKMMGYQVVLLTGDRKEIAEATAKELGVDEVLAELLPDQKVGRVRELQREERPWLWSEMV